MSDALTNEREIFLAALDLEPESRVAFVERACSMNPTVGHRVLDLLDAFAAAGDYLAQPDGAHVPSDELIDTFIGAYKLLERIGEGGFGVVYVAEQFEPLRRRVALKVLKPGVDSKQVIARFEAERQALARMDHPNIARVIDGGTSANGRPYFVMELVRGVPITTFCDDDRLTPRERIELMIDVCNAVQHAHQKGVIHRDLKPTNILVTRHDERAVAKVIDFGIAKATEGVLTDKTIYTEFRQFMGTPAYMSPEQAEMSGLDIDTRTDIYSLGVLLYELLTGTPPIEPTRLLQAGLGEMQRIIREDEPPLPSTRLSSLGAGAATIAAARRTEPGKLHRLMSGDLDWIVMKSIEKDRTRRYESAASLAADLRRHLRDEPVEAGPPSAAYRIAKFVRRNRTGVVAAALVIGAILAGLALAIAGFVRASIDRDDAIHARNDERAARQAAERMAERARVRSDFISWGLGVGDFAIEGNRASLTVRQMLDVAAASIDREYADSPQRRALAHQQLGGFYHTLFLGDEARREFEAALALWRASPNDRDDAAMVAAIRDLIYVRLDQSAPQVELEPLRRERALLDLDILEERSSDRATVNVVRSAVIALLDGPQLKPSALAALEKEVFAALDRSSFECRSDEFLVLIDALAISLYSASNRWADPAVVGPYLRVIDWADARCPDLARNDKTMALFHVVAADLATWAGRFDDALRLARRSRDEMPNVLPPGHWLFAEAMSLEGFALLNLGRTNEAEPLLVDGCARLIESSHGSREHIRSSMIRVLRLVATSGRGGHLRRFDSPLRALAEPIERYVIEFGGRRDDEARAASATALAAAVRAAPRGDADPRPEAVATLLFFLEPYADSVGGSAARPCRELLEALVDFASSDLTAVRSSKATALWWAGVLALTQGDFDAAAGHFQQALSIHIADLGTDHLWCHNCRRMLGRVLLARGELDEGANVVVKAFNDMRRTGTPAARAVIAAARDAALGLGSAGREGDAGELLATQIAQMLEAERSTDVTPTPIPASYYLLVVRPLALIAGLPVAHYEVAERGARRAIEGLPDSGIARLALAVALQRQGRCAEALPFLFDADAVDESRKRPANPVVALFRASCERALGHEGEATASLAEAHRRAVDFSFDSYTTRTWESLVAELAPRR